MIPNEYSENAIKGFNGDYRFLSNFYKIPIEYQELVYPSTENAYQASKLKDPSLREQFTTITAPESKELIKSPSMKKLCGVYHPSRLHIMYEVNVIKYRDPKLRNLLLLTGSRYIEETNTWNDTYWGVCGGVGCNHLGHIIMLIRSHLVNYTSQL